MPRGLKSERKIKSKGVFGTTEVKIIPLTQTGVGGQNLPMKILTDITDWMWAVIKEWVPWVGGSGLVVVIDYGHKLEFWPEPNRRIYGGILALGFVVSMFLAWRKERETVTAKVTKLKEIEDAKPHIILRNPYTEKVPVTHDGTSACVANVLRVRLENTPQNHYPNNEAKGVTAKISFYDSSHNILIADMDGRWTDSAPPKPLGPNRQSVVPLLETDFRIGAKHDLDVAFRDVTLTQVYGDGPGTGFVALNNDNFGFQYLRKPEHSLVGERFVAKISINAVWVNSEFCVEFWAMPHGEIGFRLV